MKFATTLLALAASAFAYDVAERGEEGDRRPVAGTTLTTYTTVTTCPITATKTEKGSTFVVTSLTTSTIVVTECHGCGGGITTVPGPVTTQTQVNTDYVTITSLCPVTKTVTQDGKVVTVTYTTTEIIKTNAYTTITETVAGPETTKTAYDTEWTTITSFIPVTKTTTLAGKATTITVTNTAVCRQNKWTTIWETYTAPDVTKTAHDTQWTTITSYVPVTKTTTIGGKLTTVTYTNTEVCRVNAETTIWETYTAPDVTKTAYDDVWTTITSLVPVTKTTTIGGKATTLTVTETNICYVNQYTTIWETKKLPDVTKTAYDDVWTTITSLVPVTKTTTIDGKATTLTVTETNICYVNQYTTIWETKKLPDVTKTEVDKTWKTITSLIPVTKTTEIAGKQTTVTYTDTELCYVNDYTTIYETKTGADVTKTEVDKTWKTITSLIPVTKTTEIAGKQTTVTYTDTELCYVNDYTTIYETKTRPGEIKTQIDKDWKTITSLVSVTKTTEVGGKPTTVTYVETELCYVNDYTTVYETKTRPGATLTAVNTQYQTLTSKYPVTETQTVNGEVVYKTYTTVQVIVTNVPEVYKETKYLPGVTQTEFAVQYSTLTSKYPVTETKTVNGEVVTKVYTSTQILYTQIATTIEAVETVYKTVGGNEVITQYSKVYYTVGGGTVVATIPGKPTTVVIPETTVVQQPPVTVTSAKAGPTTTAPVPVIAGAADNRAPAAAFLAGIVGALALL